MNFKILLVLNENSSRIKKLRLEAGEYTLGTDSECQIKVKDDNIAKRQLDIVVDAKGSVNLVALSKKKLTYVNGKLLKVGEKVKIENKDKITFEDSDKELMVKVSEVKRERSRSKSPELEKEDDNKHIKSEVIWNSVEFENKNKKDKFLRLLGANKHKTNSNNDAVEDKNLAEKLKSTFKKIEMDLEKQFLNSRCRK